MHFPISILKFSAFFLGLILISFNYSLFTFGHSRINFISVFPVFFILPISKSPFLSLSRIVGICWFTSIIVYSLLASPGFGLSRNNFISVFPVFYFIWQVSQSPFPSLFRIVNICVLREAHWVLLSSQCAVMHITRLIFLQYYWLFFNFSTFRHLGGGIDRWSILLNILNFFEFSIFRPLGRW